MNLWATSSWPALGRERHEKAYASTVWKEKECLIQHSLGLLCFSRVYSKRKRWDGNDAEEWSQSFQGLDLLHRMGGGPVLGQIFFPQTRCFLSEEHAEFVRGAFEEGSQAFDPSPVRTVARSMVAMLARAAGGMGKLRTIVRSQDIVGLRTALWRPMRLREIWTLSALESASWFFDW